MLNKIKNIVNKIKNTVKNLVSIKRRKDDNHIIINVRIPWILTLVIFAALVKKFGFKKTVFTAIMSPIALVALIISIILVLLIVSVIIGCIKGIINNFK